MEPLQGLHLNRSSSPTEPIPRLAAPSVCVIAQGSREVSLGEACYRYDPGHYLITTAELPIVGQVVEASKERPCLSLRLDLDPVIVGSVIGETGLPSPQRHTGLKAIDVSPLDTSLLDTAIRLVKLVDSPSEARVLQPIIMQEMVYRLLVGNQGDRLRNLTVLDGPSNRITRAIERIRRDFDKSLRIESLAQELGMSASGFHAQFKAITTMSPLQFLKQIRLKEARRLMLAEGLDVATAGRRVGYVDASHFNRDYKRRFGAPPMRDVQRLRKPATTSIDV